MANQSSVEQYIAKFPKSRALYEKAKRIFRNGVTVLLSHSLSI